MTDRGLRKFPPLKADHPLVGEQECQACNKTFKTGDVTTLILLGPGAYAESQERAREGRAHTAIASPVHWICATGQDEG